MLVQYTAIASAVKNAFIKNHPRGDVIMQAIEVDLHRDPYTRGIVIKANTYMQVFTPEVTPTVEIHIVYLLTEEKLLVTKMKTHCAA